MNPSQLDSLMSLNEELVALKKADVIFNLGLEKHGRGTAANLERINAVVARQVSRGSSLEEAVNAEEQAIPLPYRCMVLSGLRCGNVAQYLGRFSATAESDDSVRHIVSAGFFYPMLICCMAYTGLVAFCIFLVPTLQSMQDSLWVTPGPALAMLSWLRSTLSYWIAIPPLMLVAFVLWRWRTSSRSEQALPVIDLLFGVSRTSSRWHLADFAETVADLLDAGTPLEQSLELATGLWGEQTLTDTVHNQAVTPEEEQTSATRSQVGRMCPPLLRWALFASDAEGHRSQSLRAAAHLYRETAASRTSRLRLLAPEVTCVILGGAAALLYGLALFVPVIELLKTLAS